MVELKDATRDRRLARALEQLAEMEATVGQVNRGVCIAVRYPNDWNEWAVRDQVAWLKANQITYAKPGDAEDIAKAIGRAHTAWKTHANWKAYASP